MELMGEVGPLRNNQKEGWGDREGTEKDKDILGDIIKAELQVPGNRGRVFWSAIMINDSFTSKIWTRISQRLLAKDFTNPTRHGHRTTTMLVPSKRFNFT